MRKIFSFILLSSFPLILIIGILSSGISACCNHERIQFCFKLYLINECDICKNGILLYTNFFIQFSGQRKESNVFASEPYSICMEGDENGGESVFAQLIRVCKNPITQEIFVMICRTDLDGEIA